MFINTIRRPLPMVHEVHSFDAREEPLLTNRFVDANAEVIHRDVIGLAANSLERVSSGRLFEQDARIHLKLWGNVTYAGCYQTQARSGAEEGKGRVIRGLFKIPFADSILPRLIVWDAVDWANAAYGEGEFTARVRVFPLGFHDRMGRPHANNRASWRVFAEMGFVADGRVRRSHWNNDHYDANMAESVEQDGTIRVQQLRSTRRTAMLVRQFLRETRGTRGAT